MKLVLLSFLLSLISSGTFAFQVNGRISHMGHGAYRIMYPQQIIKVYFNYDKYNGLNKVFTETDLSSYEQMEIAKLIKQQIDAWPEAFVNEFVDVEIYPLSINSRHEFGYLIDNQMIIDVRKIKQGMSFKNSVKSSLAHQAANIIKEHPNTKEASSRMRNYLNSIHLTYTDDDDQGNYSIYEQGYVSRYASGELSGLYSPELEFAELFAHLTCDDNKDDLLNFVNNNPNNILSIKVGRFMDYLTEEVPGFDRAYFQLEDLPSYSTPSYDDVDGDVLLSIHELRSYQSVDFESMNEVESSKEPIYEEDLSWLPGNEPDFQDEPFAAAWENEPPEVEYEVYRNSDPETTYERNEEPREYKSKKKKNKKNGKGLLLTGAAIYVLLQILK